MWYTTDLDISDENVTDISPSKNATYFSYLYENSTRLTS